MVVREGDTNHPLNSPFSIAPVIQMLLLTSHTSGKLDSKKRESKRLRIKTVNVTYNVISLLLNFS